MTISFDHLEEEDYEDDDGMEKNEDILPQSTHFQNRVFLACKKERTTVLQLLNGEIEMKDFISAGMKSRNGALLQDLMEYLDDRFVNLPEEYSNFIKNISKAYSVSSLIQVTCEEPLKILKAFCQTNLDLLAAENSSLLKIVQRQMPPFWNLLAQILKLENTSSLPSQISAIILQLLDIRDRTFNEAVERNLDDYIDWDDDWGVPPLSYYPNHPKKKILRKYVVNHTKDRELCQKPENSSKTHASGVFSFGCLCPKAITMGFELMKQPESPHNIFRFLMTRDFLQNDGPYLEGVIYDNGCTLSKYILNREAKQFQWMRTMVDGMHWNGHKKTRGGGKSPKGALYYVTI